MVNRLPVLFIAYQFPPQGGPGVHRSVRFVSHLRDNAFEPIVLTQDLESIHSGNYPLDESLMENLPAHLKIIRVNSNERIRRRNFLMKFRLYGLYRYLFYRKNGEPSLVWAEKSFEVALDIIKKENIKIVYTSSAPFSALLLAERLKREAKVKWIADLRDPWTDAFTWHWPSESHWKKNVLLEKELLNKADRIIVVTSEMKKLFLNKGIGTEQKIDIIYNGY
jgi:glycosyltransferase involved in cell wall biosynthesis